MSDEVYTGMLNKHGLELYELAMEVGWTAQNTQRNAVLLHAPAPNQAVTITLAAQVNDHKFKAWGRKILRYGDPARVATLEAKHIAEAHVEAPVLAVPGQRVEDLVRGGQSRAPEEIAKRLLPSDIKQIEELAEARDMTEALRKGIEVMQDQGAPTWLSPSLDQDTETPVAPEPEAETPPTDPPEGERTVISERPWLARRGVTRAGDKGRYYQSETTIERKWSDDTVDYRCAKDGCDFDAPNPRSVTAHWATSPDHPKIDQPTRAEEMVGPAWDPKHREQKAPSRLPLRLARQIEDALNLIPGWEEQDPDDLAMKLAQLINERRKAERDEADPPRELTIEERMERIRQLADDGSYLRRLEQEQEQKEHIAYLEQMVEAEVTGRAQAQARFERVSSELRALKELIAGIGSGDDDSS